MQKNNGKRKKSWWGWVKRMGFDILIEGWRVGRNTEPQYLQRTFIWTLASYSKIVRGNCPHFLPFT